MGTRKLVLILGGGLVAILLVAAAALYILWLPNKTDDFLDPGIAALNRLEDATENQPEFIFQNGFPRFVHVQLPAEGENSVERARNFLEEYQDLYQQNDPALELHVRRVTGQDDEFVLFYQTYLGIEVYGSELLVMLDGEDIQASVGGLLPAGVVLDTYPLLDSERALEIAKEELDRPEGFVIGVPTIMIYDPSINMEVPSDPHLVWRIPLGPGSTHLVYVDAHDGEVLLDGILSYEGYELDHEDANGYADGNVDCYWHTTDDDWIGDEDGLLEEYHSHVDAVNSWWYSHDVYYFFRGQYGRDAFDGDGGELELYIYSGTPNARWVGGTGCDMIEFRQGWVGWDVMVHEYSHGVEFYSSQIGMHGGYGQNFALKESFADIQAMFADSDDWLLGDSMTGIGGFMRNIASPVIGHYDNYDTSGTKSAGYDNSGIPSKAAYLTAVGGTQQFYLGAGLGRKMMGHLYYAVMLTLPSNATFLDARNLALSYATKYFTTEQACMVRNAWASVGIGNADVGCDGILDPDITDTDGDHTIDVMDNCPEIYNPMQKDYDYDEIGDECDFDDDNDFVNDTEDNCPWIKNTDQADDDGDGKGDLCDDEDGDHVIDVRDNCPEVPNTNQVDSDDDGFGNACDSDLDGDGVDEYGRGGALLDNCPFEYNPDQLDSDGDGIGDGCDDCPNDADTNQAYTAVDPFLASLGALPEPYQPDSDGDGIPDACDGDIRFDPDRMRVLGSQNEVELQGKPGKFYNVPIPVCPPEEGVWYSQQTRGKLVLQNVDDKVGVWLGDSAGFGAGKTKDMGGGQRVIEFSPRGGMDYFLLVGFAPDYSPDQQTQFSIMFDCYEREVEEAPPDEDNPPTGEVPGFPPVALPATTLEPGEEPQTTEEATPEETASRCDLFDGKYSLTMLDIPYGSTALTLFIQMPGGVPGLEVDIPGDDQPWEYSAYLGNVNADRCSYQGYAGRLYCDFGLPETYLDTVQPLAVYVNGCGDPIFEHPRVSVFAPEEPELACSAELAEDDCIEAGGTYGCLAVCSCQCP